MKKVFILLLLCFSYALQAQDTIEHWSDTYYYEPLNVDIPSIQYKMINKSVWDNLEKEHEHTEIFQVAIPKKFDVDFFDLAKKVKVKGGYEYLLHVKAIDGLIAYVDVITDIHDSTVIKVYDKDYKLLMEKTSKHNFDKIKRHNGHQNLGSYGNEKNELIIIFFEPKKYKDKSSILIKHILWGHNVNQSLDPEFKSLAQDTEDRCGSFITCSDKEEMWRNMYSSIVQLSYVYIDTNFRTKLIRFTGSLLNTNDNYNRNAANEPYLMTCLHGSDPGVNSGLTLQDIYEWTDNTQDGAIRIRYKYARRYCDEPTNIDTQVLIDTKFKIIEKGNRSHDKDWAEDYIFLQFDGETIDDLTRYKDVTFAGWKNDLQGSYDYATTAPNYVFHHGILKDTTGGELDEMRYAIDYEYAYPSVDGKTVRLIIDEGNYIGGGSGAPIFSNEGHIIGMCVHGSATPCYLQGDRIAGGPSFSHLYTRANLAAHLGTATQAHNFNTKYLGLKKFCSNCKTDYLLGEEDFNCGGGCQPCKSWHLKGAVNYAYLMQKPEYLTSSSDVVIGLPGTESYMVSQNLTVSTKGSIIIPQNTTFKAGIKVNLDGGAIPIVYTRPAQEFTGCYQIPSGIKFDNNLWAIFKDVAQYTLNIYDRVGKEIGYNSGQVLWDGRIDIWDSRNTLKNLNKTYVHTLYFVLDLIDTKGGSHTQTGFFVLGP